MDVHAATGLIEQVNEHLDPVALLERIGYATDKIQVVGGSVKSFCPIHKDSRFRSLLVDAKKRTFKCTIKTCEAYRGGNLVELYALARGLEPLAAATELVRVFDLDIDITQLNDVANAFLDEAERAFVDHDHTRAERAARQALQFRSDLIEARLLLANILAAKGEAAQACDEFIAVAENYLNQGAFEDADRVLERASQDYPDNEDLLLLKVHSAEQQGKLDIAEKLLLELAQRREGAGRKAENVGIFEKLSSLFPSKLEYCEKLAEILCERREFDKALTTLNNLAFRYAQDEKPDEVVRVVEKAAAIRRPEAGIQSIYVDALVKLGEYERARSAMHDLVLAFIESTMFFDAQQAAQRWLEVEPESPEVHEWLGLIWQEQANAEEAAREFRAAAELAYKQGNIQRAIELLGQARFNLPDDADLRWLLIKYLREAQEIDQAIEELRALAEFCFATGDVASGEKALLQALEMRPTTALRLELAPILVKHGCRESAGRLYLAAAHECEELDDISGAVACYQSYLELCPDDQQAKHKYIELLWESDLRGLATKESLELLENVPADQKKDYALTLLPRIVSHPPTDRTALERFLNVALEVEAYDTARHLFLLLMPQYSGEELERAITVSNKLLEQFPEDKELLEKAVEWHSTLGHSENAVELHIRIADVAQKSGDYRSALAHLAAALELQPERVELVKRRAELLAYLDDPALARAAQKDYLALVEKRGDTASLLREYQEYLEKYPDDVDVRRRFAELLVTSGSVSEAIGEFLKLLSHFRGVKDRAKEREVLERLVELQPENLEYRIDLADSCRACGDVEKALGEYLVVLEKALPAEQISLAKRAAEAGAELEPQDLRFVRGLLEIAKREKNDADLEKVALKLAKLGEPEELENYYKKRVAELVEQRSIEEAEELVSRWRATFPESLDALEAVAKVATVAGHTKRAVEAYVELARAYSAVQRHSEAIDALRAALALDGEAIEARSLLCQSLLDANREHEAIEEMSALADFYVDRRDYRNASTWLSRILEYRTNSPETLERLASLVYEFEGFAKALPYYRKLFAIYKETRAVDSVCSLYEKLLELEPSQIELRTEYADYLEQAGRLREAKEQYLLLAQICRDELNSPLQAIPFLGKATLLDPGPADAEIFEQIADLYLASEQIQFAAGSLRDAIRLYESQAQRERALKAQQRLCSLKDATFEDWVHLGELLQASRNDQEALAAFRKAYAIAEESTSVGRDARISLCEQIVSLAPDDVEMAVTLIEYLPPEEAATRAIQMAQGYLEKGLSEAAITILETGRRIAPKNIAVREELARLWRQSGDTEKLAEELFGICEIATSKKAAKVRNAAIEELRSLPRTPLMSLRLANLMADTGDTDNAVESYARVAEELLEEGNWEYSLEALNSAFSLSPAGLPPTTVAKVYRASEGDPRARLLAERVLDMALMARSRTNALVVASALLERASETQSKDLFRKISEKAGAAFLVSIASVHLEWLIKEGQNQAAEKLLEFILELSGNSPDAWYLAAQIYKKIGASDKAASASLQAARLFAQAGAVTEEESCYREVLEVYPDDIPTLETLISFYERERRKADLIDLTKRLIDLALAKNDHEVAARWLGKLIEHDPGNIELREKHVEELLKAGRGEEAVRALLELARMLRNLKFVDRAFAAYERVLFLDPEHEETMAVLLEFAEEVADEKRGLRYAVRLAEFKSGRGQHEEACRILKSFGDKHPEQTEIWEKLLRIAEARGDHRHQTLALRTLGYHYAKIGAVDAAIATFEKLLSIEPDNKDAMKILLDCYATAKQTQKAAELANKLFEIERALGNPARIRESALTVLAFDERRATVRQQLAAILYELGEREEAVRQWWRAAEIFMGEKNYSDAISCLKSITSFSPHHLDAWRRLAELYLLTGDEDSARDAFVRLAGALAEEGKNEEACRVLERVVEHGDVPAEVRERALEVYRRCGIRAELLPEIVWLAHYHLNRRNYSKAEQLIAEGLELDPEDLSLLECRIQVAKYFGRREEVVFRLRELAQKYLSLGDKQKAAEMLSGLLAEDPGLVDVRLQLAKLYEETGQIVRAQEEYLEVVRTKLEASELEEAREIAEAALQGKARGMEFRARLAELFAEHRVSEVAARYYLQCAKEAEEKNLPEKAIHYLQLAVEVRPRWIEAYQELARISLDANKVVDALGALEQLTELLLDQKRLREAVEVLRKRIQLAPREVQPRYQLLELLELLGERDARFQQLQELGDLLVSVGNIEEAVEVYRQLSSLKPDDPTLLSRYLELFAQVGNELEVLDDYQRLADLYIRKGQYQEATRTFEHILSIDRRQRDIREKFIQFLLGAGQRGRALAEMVKLADICTLMGDYNTAVKWLVNAHALNPNDLNILESLADAYAKAQNPVAAAEHYFKLVRACASQDVYRAVEGCRRILELVPDHRPTREIFSSLLMQIGERAEAAANALALAELYRAAGDEELAAKQEQLAKEYEPETIESLSKRLQQDKDNPQRLYEDLVRLGDLYYLAGDVDRALEHYRQARQIDDSSPELIRKYVNAFLQIAPEHEAIQDLIELARSYEGRGAALRALETYEQVLKIDAQNKVAKAGRVRMRKITNAE